MAKARDSPHGEYLNLSLIADSFMWSACTCQILRPTTMLKRDLMRRYGHIDDGANDIARCSDTGRCLQPEWNVEWKRVTCDWKG